MTLLEVQHLQKIYTTRFSGTQVKALTDVSFSVEPGEYVAIMGESGSGKSVFTKSFLGMLDANGSITGGSIVYDGVDISKYKTEKEWLTIRGKKISMVMQDPMTSLNPLKKIGKQIQESIELCQGIKGEEAKKLSIEMLKKVGIPDPERRANQYPHEFSGGMRQRVVIAIAVACRPQILICDEPTTALDVTIQAQVLSLIGEMQKRSGVSTIFITHDLGVVAHVADRVAVMYAGKIVEYGTAEDIFYDPQHPYTWSLMASMPDMDLEPGDELSALHGTPPNMLCPPEGDAFAERNPWALKIDQEKEPPMFKVSDTHYAATWMLHPSAPKVERPKVLERRIANSLKRKEEMARG